MSGSLRSAAPLPVTLRAVRSWKRYLRHCEFVLALAAVGGLWHAVSMAVNNSTLVPPPLLVLDAWISLLGDELPSEQASNQQLLAKALRDVRSGDILVAHLGIWSRKDPWAPAVLEPLITGLKARGFCFATLRDHPDYRDWVARAR